MELSQELQVKNQDFEFSILSVFKRLALEIIFRQNTLKAEQVLRLKEDKIYNSDMKLALDGENYYFEEGISNLYNNFTGLNL